MTSSNNYMAGKSNFVLNCESLIQGDYLPSTPVTTQAMPWILPESPVKWPWACFQDCMGLFPGPGLQRVHLCMRVKSSTWQGRQKWLLWTCRQSWDEQSGVCTHRCVRSLMRQHRPWARGFHPVLELWGIQELEIWNVSSNLSSRLFIRVGGIEQILF